MYCCIYTHDTLRSAYHIQHIDHSNEHNSKPLRKPQVRKTKLHVTDCLQDALLVHLFGLLQVLLRGLVRGFKLEDIHEDHRDHDGYDGNYAAGLDAEEDAFDDDDDDDDEQNHES